MLKRYALAVLLLAAPVAAQQTGNNGLAVHEWGTFTSVAGAEGDALQWRPLATQSDLPCFVRMMPDNIKTQFGADGLAKFSATVRMETPVLYFYAPSATDVDVRVALPQGAITEWFPNASVTPAFAPLDLRGTGTIEWPNVRVEPTAKPAFLTEFGASHYYAARDTDASPLSVNGQYEKFLFYRGIANFPVPLKTTIDATGAIVVENGGPYDVSNLVLFENRGGKIGYRRANGPRGRTTIDAPELTASFDSLRADLEHMLVAQGLFEQEAKAMVATWRDSWFEEGTRLFYIVPKVAVDEILPLAITPRPADVARAFVGRIEIMTPATVNQVEAAFARKDLATLDKFGRFLEPIGARVLATPGARVTRTQVDDAIRLLAASHTPENGCRKL